MKVPSEIIKNRISCRSYSDRPIENNELQELSALVNSEHTGPFGNQPKFKLIHMNAVTPREWKKMGTYGVIRNARFFVVGIIKDGLLAMEDYGYCKEILLLKATALGMGTCWLGGTFQSGGFARAAGLQKGEKLPTISPIGYPADEKSLTEKIMRRFAGSDHRKPWAELFFAGDFSKPLTPLQAGKYVDMLENLRLAPSASNKQPWRILLDTQQNVLHFYLSRTPSYKLLRLDFLQDIDMGIAMSHFEITAREQGLDGIWKVDTNALKEKSLDYIASWQKKI